MKSNQSLYLFMLIFLLVGCSDSREDAQPYQFHLVLSGESEHWEIEGYELQYDEKRYKSGNGKLAMKNIEEYVSDYLSMRIQVVTHGKDKRIQSYSVSGSDMNIVNHQIGTIEGIKMDSDEVIKKEDIDQIYATIIWRESQEKKDLKERILLYEREADSFD
ncbi:hypothetical protein SAMN05421743_103356 [Thalassobacillus cyri]|uniref:Uncharacterized protein n=1 Tax=Thalassobacillus cyri TaxID=571932 RepID=A0A1H3ZSR0_9BACI|nr:hypothetical protein [Thalassobacillus cyri]SEA26760.1 hypothetical protein SAMN05421743_103356 [Thalassobacillus cyri]